MPATVTAQEMETILDAEPVQEEDCLFTDDEWEEFLFLSGQPNAISDMPTMVR